MKIEVLCGLPGAGKTTWAKEQLNGYVRKNVGNNQIIEDREKKVVYCDFDYIMTKHRTKKLTVDELYKQMFNSINSTIAYYSDSSAWRVILDGLFIQHNDYIRIAEAFKQHHIIFHWWKPDVKVCLRNDMYRREENSKEYITGLNFEIPEPVSIKLAAGSEGKLDDLRHISKRKSGYQLFCDKYKLGESINSESWSNGGTHNDCYGHTYESSAESPLSTFQEFDELIERINEDISFMKYKKLYNASVECDSYNDSGYYGGSKSSSYYRCDTQKLYDKLIELDLLPEEFL